MTPEEHRLVLWILVRQFQNTKTLIEILRSRGVLEPGDAEAFASTVFWNDDSNHAILEDAKRDYLEIAKSLGVVTGLEPK